MGPVAFLPLKFPIPRAMKQLPGAPSRRALIINALSLHPPLL